jgi:hypothetical protein
MSATIHFHTADVERLLSIVGSADRDLLRAIGVRPGEEFRASLEEEEDLYEDKDSEDEDDLGEDEEVEEEWDFEEEATHSAKEVLTKMVMAGVPPDLADNEAAAIQGFMASHALDNHIAHDVDTDEAIDAAGAQKDPELSDAIRKALLEGVDGEEMSRFTEWLQDSEASPELIARAQMLCFGRVADSEEPSSIEPDINYPVRSGYLRQEEIAHVSDELSELAEAAAEEMGSLPRVLAALFHYANVKSQGLFVTIEE